MRAIRFIRMAILTAIWALAPVTARIQAGVVLQDDFSGPTINRANWDVHAAEGTITQDGELVFANGSLSWNKCYVTSAASFARVVNGRSLAA